MKEIFSSSAVPEVEPWVRVSLECVQGDFSKLLRMAQPYNAFLRRIRVIAAERFDNSPYLPYENVTLLVPELYVRHWSRVDDIEMEHLAGHEIATEFADTLDERGLVPKYE